MSLKYKAGGKKVGQNKNFCKIKVGIPKILGEALVEEFKLKCNAIVQQAIESSFVAEERDMWKEGVTVEYEEGIDGENVKLSYEGAITFPKKINREVELDDLVSSIACNLEGLKLDSKDCYFFDTSPDDLDADLRVSGVLQVSGSTKFSLSVQLLEIADSGADT
ncbi:MAG: hypothetical protein NTZ80_02485 [Patescibacteria group bacterium]|nr:hypothetical protein [Patescibacteria group bacterium]